MEITSNKKPRIGILTQKPSTFTQSYIKAKKYTPCSKTIPLDDIETILLNSTVIDDSYLKFIEKAGMLPVPLLLDSSKKEIQEQLEKLNCIVFIGGAESLYVKYVFGTDKTTKYQRRVSYLLKQAKKINDNGRFFVVWGVCLGYQAVICAENANNNIVRRVDHKIKAYKSNIILKGAELTELGKFLNEDISLLEEPINYFNHKFGVLLEDFYEYKNVSEKIRPLSYIHLDNGYNVLTCAEYISYPFYLLLFHPEANKGIGDVELDKKRIQLQNKLASFISFQLDNAKVLRFEEEIRAPNVILQLHNGHGTKSFYVNKKLVKI